jgi:acetylornithine deacetylase/succinyl-diaminopimelate desuccinylase-like protein
MAPPPRRWRRQDYSQNPRCGFSAQFLTIDGGETHHIPLRRFNSIMSRADAIAAAAAYFDSGQFFNDLARRVASRTESQSHETGSLARLQNYLTEEVGPSVQKLGFTPAVVANSVPGAGPFLIAERHEGAGLPTVLIYGHGDVVMGEEGAWRRGLSPWRIVVEGDRWYGRGTADNKGQHTINLAALGAVLAARGGRAGFNAKLLIEMGEEIGSPGLHALARSHGDALAADVLIASDGPRISAERPTVFLGSRGAFNFELRVNLRCNAHHSGNWGGLLANPGTILAHAIASLIGRNGRILAEALRPQPVPDNVRKALAGIQVGGGPNDPAIDPDWGEPGLTPAERVLGWNALEVLAFEAGNPATPLNAVPGSARATLQLRYVVGTNVGPRDGSGLLAAVRAHLDAQGFSMVEAAKTKMEIFAATRLHPDDPWVGWALASIAATVDGKPALLPNLGGSLPNDVFADLLGLPTIWVPHSYPACCQHGPDEHLLASVSREALQIMAGLFWDLGETGAGIIAARVGRST